MFDAVVVGSEAVVYPPEDGLGSAADVDFAVDRPDVGLHGVGAEVGQPRHVGVALALGDEGEDLGFSVAETFASPGPIKADRAAPARRDIADDHFACMHRL